MTNLDQLLKTLVLLKLTTGYGFKFSNKSFVARQKKHLTIITDVFYKNAITCYSIS